MPHFTVHPTPGGRWAVCERVPGTDTVSAICDCPTQASAQEQADAHKAERERIAQLQQHFPPVRWRQTQPGPRALHAAAYATARTLPEGLW